MSLFRKLLLVIAVFAVIVPAHGQEGKLNPAKELRARALFTELRCVVCQNQSIDSSDADVAKDLREIVREQIGAGKTDVEIKQFLVNRYGQFILLKPKFGWHTLLLWGLPLVLLIGGGIAVTRLMRKPKVISEQKLSKSEEDELSKFLSDS